MSSELSAAFGLLSAVSWGIGDFSGGIAAKRVSNIVLVVFLSQIVGLICLVGLALLSGETVYRLEDLLLGAIAGVTGVVGMIALYRGLATRGMGLVAPVSSVITVLFPVMIGILMESLPELNQLVGFVVAIGAIWLVSNTGSVEISFRSLDLPIIAGISFGLFFIFIDQVTTGIVFWPLVASRFASLSLLGTILLVSFRTQRFKVVLHDSGFKLPIICAGVFDIGGNAFFTLAAQFGRLDIASVLTSLFSVVTVLLAWIILKEHITKRQWVGVGMASVAVVFITT